MRSPEEREARVKAQLDGLVRLLAEVRDNPQPPLPPDPLADAARPHNLYPVELGFILTDRVSELDGYEHIYPDTVMVTTEYLDDEGMILEDPLTLLDLLNIAKALGHSVYGAGQLTFAPWLDEDPVVYRVDSWAGVNQFVYDGQPLGTMDALPLETLLKLYDIWQSEKTHPDNAKAYRVLDRYVKDREQTLTIACTADA